MNLEHLFDGIPVASRIHWNPHKIFSRITSDSRAVNPHDVFVACRGSRMDGHDFLNQAIYAGAGTIVFEEFHDITLPRDVTAIQVENSQACLSRLLKRFYHDPDETVKLVGTTGTNGKTTVSYLLHQLLASCSHSSYIGTLWYDLPGEKVTAMNTTPGPELLMPMLRDMKKKGTEYCVMEVSSHALDQCRVHGLQFELAIFTQLTQDHLDYHTNLEKYFHAKRKLFGDDPAPRGSLINRDCAYGQRLLEEYPMAKSYGMNGKADYEARDVETGFRESRFTFCVRNRKIPVRIQLPMRHNVDNALTVLAALDMLGFDPETFLPRLEAISGIPGRMERIAAEAEFDVFVDYAHTPDAFENVLSEARKLAPGRILTLFGCGGDRDRKKRPLMGRIACHYSDLVMVTSDNPRSEDPEHILRDIRRGTGTRSDNPACRVMEQMDRTLAIQELIGHARPGDVVLILGKGHEDYQILGDRKIPFDDRILAQDALKRKGRVFSG